MKLLLDTHAFLWLVEGSPNLSSTSQTALADLGNELFLSVASVWEQAIKTGISKLTLSDPLDIFLSKWTTAYQLALLPVEAPHALAVPGLADNHRDPFDRMLIAQALVEGMTVATADPKTALYPVPILWGLPMTPIYLDYNATTPVDPAVCEAVLPYLHTHFGNPSSSHVLGRTTHDAVDQGRQQVAALIGARPEEIVFTGGGSEASNQAIKGAVFAKLRGLFARWGRGAHVITSAVEHPATLQPCEFVRRLGCKVTVLPVDRHGLVDPADARKALTRSTTLVTIMHSNNEVGTLQPIREIAVLAKQYGALMHTDCAQSLGKLTVNVDDLGVDLLTVAGHKLYAPKGIGVLYVRTGTKLEPLIHGAGHESGRRAGTENVPYIVGLGKACELARQSLPGATEKLKALRERLWLRLREAFGADVHLNGHPERRLPNTLNVSFRGHIGAELLEKIPQVAASTGSACHEGQHICSPVLRAMGYDRDLALGAVRLSVGRFTTEGEIDIAAAAFQSAAATVG